MEQTIKILKTETFEDFSEIVEFSNAACEVTALDGYQVNFDIEATNKNGEKRKFHIVLQSEDRNNGLEAYSGYDMYFGTAYGCDADEWVELEKFIDYDEEIKNTLISNAEDEAKYYLEANKSGG